MARCSSSVITPRIDPESGEWLEGYEKEREAWEAEYNQAYALWLAHKEQVSNAAQVEEEAVEAAPAPREQAPATYSSGSESTGTLASDEALAALREKLTGH